MARPLVCLPDHRGAALLHAALDPAEAALRAWHRVRPELDLGADAPRSELRVLLPLVSTNLPLDQLPEADRAALQASHARALASNEGRLALAERWLALFELGGISATVLKGMALVVRDYRDLGARFMADIDLLVPRDQADRALDLLEGAGWVDAGGCSRDVLHRLHHGCGMIHPERTDGAGLDVHWELSSLLVGYDPHVEPLAFGTQTAAVLDPTDTLLHVCLHGLWSGSAATTRWIADAVTVLRRADSIDTARLEQVAAEHEVGALLGAALAHLQSEHQVPHLGDLPRRLQAQPVGVRRRQRQRALTAPPDRFAAIEGLTHLRAYWAYTRWEWPDARALRDAPHYLAYVWGAERPRDLPATALAGLRRRVRSPMR